MLQNYSKLITYVFQTCYKFVTKKPGDLTVARLSKPNPSQKLRLRFSLLSIYMPITYSKWKTASIYYQNYYILFCTLLTIFYGKTITYSGLIIRILRVEVRPTFGPIVGCIKCAHI